MSAEYYNQGFKEILSRKIQIWLKSGKSSFAVAADDIKGCLRVKWCQALTVVEEV